MQALHLLQTESVVLNKNPCTSQKSKPDCYVFYDYSDMSGFFNCHLLWWLGGKAAK